MKSFTNTKTYQNIEKWLRNQTIFLVVSSMVSFVIVEFGVNNWQLSWQLLLRSLGLIIPMTLFITIINIYIARKFNVEAVDLAKGIEEASKGNYHAKLDPKQAIIFEDAYNNFNKLEEELKKANTLQDEFVNNYSHEFKTPINSIAGFACLLLSDDINEEDRKKYLKIISEESQKLSSLAENAILMTKLNSQSIVPHKKQYRLDEQIRRCVILFEPHYVKKKINFTCNLEETYYYGSEELMEHLWNNLISNAVKYTNQNGNISINLRNYANNIIFSIIDDGIGIAQKDLDNIFDKFYQVDKSKTTRGLGLGLTIVSRILQLVEGKIKVESTLSEGTNFTITLKK
ncbi:MAG: sensor histidine kinase [Erysipelotrichaceae bacterium]